MQQDYTNAALMISALRYTLTRLKLGQDTEWNYLQVPGDESSTIIDVHDEMDGPVLKSKDPAVVNRWIRT